MIRPLPRRTHDTRAGRPPDRDPRTAGGRSGGARGRPWLVQGELAAGQDDRAGPARLRPGAAQHVVQHPTGVTRGFHAEPWDKLVSVAHGRIFGAWVDLREGDSFGQVVTVELGPDKAVFVPRGVANSYQTLADDTVYSYLVNDHWSEQARSSYSYLNLADETVAVAWPIPLSAAVISEADSAHPRLAEARPVPAKQTVIIGAGGQLGRALRALLPAAVGLDLPDFDVTAAETVAAYPWSQVGVIINAAAYTAVDAAETPEGRRACWAANVTGVAALCRVAAAHRIPLVHVSSDYVFDGTAPEHTEDEGSPAGRLRPDQGRRGRPGGPAATPLPGADQLGDRRRPQLRAHHGRAGHQGRLPHRGGRPVRPAHLHRRSGRRHLPPGGRQRPVRHLQPHQRRPGAVVVRDRPGRVRTQRPQAHRREPDQHGTVGGREAGLTAAATQRSGTGQDQGSRVHSPGGQPATACLSRRTGQSIA